MFQRIFIANRGEVAARILRTARRLDIAVVCGASTADIAAGFPYLQEADAVVTLGPGAAAQSYLDLERVVQAAVQSGCSAVHPGWGFLSENSRFAALCAQHSLTFIGPSPEVMDRMGRKVPSRAAARAVGLPVVPGSAGLLADADEAITVAERVGFPVVLKADAGGGGRGIRLCKDASEIHAAFDEAAREAQAAFGSAALYLEKYLEAGRHIEFQVLGDGRGNAIHLGERECSIQRRHQKLLEEAPSPGLTDEQREHYGELCARATGAWNYAGVGTMEFLRDTDGALHFLEMNTRLQVEHGVTELITGLDLVEQQLRIAAGGALPCSQNEVRFDGHAIEVRINAEDPDEDFRPSPGTAEVFAPATGEGIRVDTHMAEGSRIPPQYDSLIAKLLAHGADRSSAIARMEAALASTRIEGIATTMPLHARILAHPDFQAGAFDTSWLSTLLSQVGARR